ncbi:MAG: hypothetical protein WB646_08250 [Steroidobacteraceae bacterium]
MTTIEMVRNGVESTIVSPEQDQLRVQIQYRVLGHGHAESIQLDVVLPQRDLTLSALQAQAVARAQELLERFQAQYRLDQTQTLAPVAAEATASLIPAASRKAE